jgi:hypothetical protein
MQLLKIPNVGVRKIGKLFLLTVLPRIRISTSASISLCLKKVTLSL